jgi:hypothetical protein
MEGYKAMTSKAAIKQSSGSIIEDTLKKASFDEVTIVGDLILARTGIRRQWIKREAPHVTKAIEAQRGLVTNTFGAGIEKTDLALYRFLNFPYYDSSGVIERINLASGWFEKLFPK